MNEEPRYSHLDEYPQDEFLGRWENFDLWVDRIKDTVVSARWGRDDDDMYSICLDFARDYGIDLDATSGDERGLKALKMA